MPLICSDLVDDARRFAVDRQVEIDSLQTIMRNVEIGCERRSAHVRASPISTGQTISHVAAHPSYSGHVVCNSMRRRQYGTIYQRAID